MLTGGDQQNSELFLSIQVPAVTRNNVIEVLQSLFTSFVEPCKEFVYDTKV